MWLARCWHASMVGLVAALTGCAAIPQSPAPISPAAGPGGAKSITIALPTDPIALAGSLSGGGKAVVPSRYFREFPNAYLTTYNGQDEIVPWLATAVPSLDDGTWNVLEDGRMQVTWKLRPGIQWHDGADLTSADLRFSWEVCKDLATGVASQSIANYVEDVATPDRQTAIFTWAAASPLGALAGVREFDVLPRHVLEHAERAGLSDTPYFTDPAQFVGSGPYRPLSWAVGNSLTLEAFGGYFLGRPRIDRVTFRIIPDAGAALAHVLSGEVDVAYWAINYEGARVVQSEWKSSGGVVEMQANNARFLLPQMRADYVRPRNLLDVRVRRALLHAMDRTELAETAASGAARVTNSTTYPDSALGRIVEARANRYDFDPARAAALFAEAGWQKGGDGVLTKAGARFELAYRAGVGFTDSNLILPVLQQQYRRSGIDLTFSPSTIESNEASVTFPGLSVRGLPVNQTGFLALFDSARIATAQRRWAGPNVHGYANPVVDDLLARVDLTLRTEDRAAVWAEANRVLLDDVAFMPLYNYPYPYVVRKGVVGPIPANPINPPSYFVHTWDLD
jgi:peptide/nickel transport system substrate-binding protein